MTKGKKQQIIQMAETLGQAIDTVQIMRQQTGQKGEVSGLLIQMQQIAIDIGNVIEMYEGQDCAIVRKLEDCCELIYTANNNIEDGIAFNQTCLQMKSLMLEITKAIRNDITVKREILFLPYQVSMWDSLESVWMAAKEDNDVECYVVPIPYYDVLPDKSLGKFHYDGESYPDYVPVTNYQEYHIGERRPDVIFFHNPYDDFNTVTRVPEEYYSSHLKQCTNMLVYIPYLISEEWGPAEHQCYTPGVLFADRVIVQLNYIYEKYCRIYTEVLKENGWTGKLVDAKKKFLPLGSPKVDKIWNVNSKLENLPKEWQKCIQKPDGSRKKIVLYNLSITTLLASGEQELRKVESVFLIFKERQEEFVLLLRPHPLLLTTINAMRPQLRDAYLNLIQRFKEDGWGIFDETPDPNLAMAISDAYYGDTSSLVTVYRETGKPLLHQNVWKIKAQKQEMRSAVWAYYNALVIEDSIWITNALCNALVQVDASDYRCKKVYTIPNEKNMQGLLHSQIIKVGDEIICCPQKAEQIAVLNLKTNLFKLYRMPEDLRTLNNLFWYQSIISYGKYVYLWGYTSIIVRMEIGTGNTKKILDNRKGSSIENYGYQVRQIGKYVYWLETWLGHTMYRLDLETEEIMSWQLKEKYNFLEVVSETIYFIKNNLIAVWTDEESDVPFMKIDMEIMHSFGDEQYLYLMGNRNPIRIKVKIKYMQELKFNNDKPMYQTPIYPLVKYKNDLIIFCSTDERFYIINENFKIKQNFEITVNFNEFGFTNSIRFWQEEMSCLEMEYQPSFNDLYGLLDYLRLTPSKLLESKQKTDTIGKKVYDAICLVAQSQMR